MENVEIFGMCACTSNGWNAANPKCNICSGKGITLIAETPCLQLIEVTDSATGRISKYTEQAYTVERDFRLMDWQNKKAALETAKQDELQARAAAVIFMHDPSKSGKTETVDLGGGYAAKFKVPLNYGFVKNADDKIDKKKIDAALSKIEKDGALGEHIAERLVKWSPSLSLSEYKTLSEKHKKIIDEVIVTSEGTPTLEIKEPKTKK